MKLIRLVTEDPSALFDNTFNEDLIVKDNSKLALQSLSIETQNNVLEIDSSNDEISFQVTTGFQNDSVRLAHAQYTRNNYENLFTDIENKLNNEIGYLEGAEENRRAYGLEWKVDLNNDKKVNVEYKIGVNGSYEDEFNYDDNKIEFVTALTRRVCRPIAGQPNNTENDRSILFDTFISRGCSFIRCRTHKFENNLTLAPESNGYIVGLSSTNISELDPTEITDAMLSYGIAVTCDATNTRQYYKVINGVYTLLADTPNYNGEGAVDNDFQEVIINFNKIQANIYENGSSSATPLFEEDYTAGTKLYPFIVFRGVNVNCNSIRTIPSPFGAVTQSTDLSTELFAPPQPRRNPSENFIQFSQSLAEFLGFENPRRPQNGYILEVESSYEANDRFNPTDIADAFLIELLNLRCESYDGLKNQRKNILAVIPKSNEGGELIYETNQPFFIDLSNAKDILLRNIRIRVVKPDYSPVKMLGAGSMVLLLDDK